MRLAKVTTSTFYVWFHADTIPSLLRFLSVVPDGRHQTVLRWFMSIIATTPFRPFHFLFLSFFLSFSMTRTRRLMPTWCSSPNSILTLRSLFSLDGDFGFFSGDEFSDAIEKWRLHRRFLQRPPRRPSLASVWESGDLVTWSSLPFHHPSCLTQFLKSVARECGGWLPLVVTVPPLPSSHLSFSAPHPHWLHNQMHWKNPTTEWPYKNASPILAAFHFHENWRRNTRQRRPNNPKHFNATYLDEGNANTATFSLIVHSTSSRQIFGFH